MSTDTGTLSAEDIIKQHSGAADDVWDTDVEDSRASAVERWWFPRFPGADTLGTCETNTKAHAGKHTETPKCTEFSVDGGNLYLSRSGIGPYDTDVETIEAWLAAPRNIVGGVMLLGEPGTGKTALVEAAATRAGVTLVTHLCTPDDTRESLFLRFVGEGNGEDGTPFVKGVIPSAVEQAAWLYLDEFMLLQDGVKPIIYQLTDGRRMLAGGNVDGSDIEVHPDFRIIVSSNPQVRGASLPEPVASRFASTTLTVETGADLLHSMGIDFRVVDAWEALGNANLWRPQIRELRLADYWLSTDPAQAVSAFIPEHCPETQRAEVRRTVISFLGGADLREDGRLVVS